MHPHTQVRLKGRLTPPGDKSVGHRLAMLSALAEGRSRLDRFPPGRDCRSTLDVLRALGVTVELRPDGAAWIEGRGASGLSAPAKDLDAGNSGTTARLMTGILAAQPFDSCLTGDASLSRRPFRRVVEPLVQMGGSFETENGFLPLRIHGGRALTGIDYPLPVPSAQVKTAVLFAGLFASGRTRVVEEIRSRDHTEIALRAFGAAVEMDGNSVSVEGGARLVGSEHRVPGDFSSAAFFLGAAAFLPGSDLVIENVGLNPTRTGFLEVLREMGADVEVEVKAEAEAEAEARSAEAATEPSGTLHVRARGLSGVRVRSDRVPSLIDEVPILAVVAAFAEGETHIEGLSELRVKESDRLAALAQGLSALGVDVELRGEDLVVRGRGFDGSLSAARLSSFRDHRMVMAWAVAALGVDGACEIDHLDDVKISYPGFWETLDRLAA